MKRAELHQGSYTAGRRTLEYWTMCENLDTSSQKAYNGAIETNE